MSNVKQMNAASLIKDCDHGNVKFPVSEDTLASMQDGIFYGKELSLAQFTALAYWKIPEPGQAELEALAEGYLCLKHKQKYSKDKGTKSPVKVATLSSSSFLNRQAVINFTEDLARDIFNAVYTTKETKENAALISTVKALFALTEEKEEIYQAILAREETERKEREQFAAGVAALESFGLRNIRQIEGSLYTGGYLGESIDTLKESFASSDLFASVRYIYNEDFGAWSVQASIKVS